MSSGLSVERLVDAAWEQGIAFMKYKREPDRLSLIFLQGYVQTPEMLEELKRRRDEVLRYVKTLPPH